MDSVYNETEHSKNITFNIVSVIVTIMAYGFVAMIKNKNNDSKKEMKYILVNLGSICSLFCFGCNECGIFLCLLLFGYLLSGLSLLIIKKYWNNVNKNFKYIIKIIVIYVIYQLGCYIASQTMLEEDEYQFAIPIFNFVILTPIIMVYTLILLIFLCIIRI